MYMQTMSGGVLIMRSNMEGQNFLIRYRLRDDYIIHKLDEKFKKKTLPR